MSYELVIPTGPGDRLQVRDYEHQGRRCVSVAPQYQDRGGAWHLSGSGLILSPTVARELAPAILAIAAGIEANPPEPMPTTADREESRWP